MVCVTTLDLLYLLALKRQQKELKWTCVFRHGSSVPGHCQIWRPSYTRVCNMRHSLSPSNIWLNGWILNFWDIKFCLYFSIGRTWVRSPTSVLLVRAAWQFLSMQNWASSPRPRLPTPTCVSVCWHDQCMFFHPVCRGASGGGSVLDLIGESHAHLGSLSECLDLTVA